MSKVACDSCYKLFTQKTLDKYDGVCGRCSKKRESSPPFSPFSPSASPSPTSSPAPSKPVQNKFASKVHCSTCDKPFMYTHLKANKGVCKKCVKNRESPRWFKL